MRGKQVPVYMTDRETLKRIVEKAAFRCLPSSTQPLHINMLTTELISHGVLVREKGEWIGEGDGVWYCPECNHCIDDGTDDPALLPNFCPNCGSDLCIEEQNKAREVENADGRAQT